MRVQRLAVARIPAYGAPVIDPKPAAPAADPLAAARAARLANDYAGAKAMAQTLILTATGEVQAEAASFYGLCDAETGRADQGRELIEEAATNYPNNGWIQFYLSQVRDLAGAQRPAIDAAIEAARLLSTQFEAWAHLGKLLGKAGIFAEATTALTRAFALRPSHVGCAMLLAGAALQAGQPEAARIALGVLDQASGEAPEFLRLRIIYWRQMGNFAELEQAAGRLLAHVPEDADARRALAHAQAQQGYPARAIATYTPLLRAGDAADLTAMGHFRLATRNVTGAEADFVSALRREPGRADALYGRGRCRLYLGDRAGAADAARAAIAADPAHGDAYGLLAEASGGKVPASVRDMLAQRLDDGAFTEDAAISARFALGEFYHASSEHAAAFAAWRAANDQRKAQWARRDLTYDPAKEEVRMAQIRALSSGPVDAAPDGPAPIFIVGMPRSGTTLLETALGAHLEVDGAGEVPAMPYFLRRALEGEAVTPEALARWRQQYLSQARQFGPGTATFVTDKQPSNIYAVGLIRQIFPEAPIIWLRRDPLETGLSIYRRNFTAAWPYTVDLGHIGHQYRLHADMADHWIRTLPGAVLPVSYETMAENFETEMRRILDFCGLPFDARCLDPAAADRAVMTFSAAQVREGPRTDHFGAALPYAAELGPLVDGLGEAGSTGSARGAG